MFAIPPEKVDEIRMWFAQRGGVIEWQNQMIGETRPETITPKFDAEGRPCKPPHYAYGNKPAAELNPSDIVVRKETVVSPPLNWFPVCPNCRGSGRRSLDSLADARAQTTETVLALWREGQLKLNNVDEEKGTFDCTWCEGTGHVERRLLVALRKRYWGYVVSNTGILRANRYAKRLGEGVKWDWENYENGKAKLIFYTEEISPFTL